MSLLRPGVIKQHRPNQTHSITDAICDVRSRLYVLLGWWSVHATEDVSSDHMFLFAIRIGVDPI